MMTRIVKLEQYEPGITYFHFVVGVVAVDIYYVR